MQPASWHGANPPSTVFFFAISGAGRIRTYNAQFPESRFTVWCFQPFSHVAKTDCAEGTSPSTESSVYLQYTILKSGWRELNPLPSPWQGVIHPYELQPQTVCVESRCQFPRLVLHTQQRRLWDSNPRRQGHYLSGFQDRRLKPLSQTSMLVQAGFPLLHLTNVTVASIIALGSLRFAELLMRHAKPGLKGSTRR